MARFATEMAFLILFEIDLITRFAYPVVALILDRFATATDSGISCTIVCHADDSLASGAVVSKQQLTGRLNSGRIDGT